MCERITVHWTLCSYIETMKWINFNQIFTKELRKAKNIVTFMGGVALICFIFVVYQPLSFCIFPKYLDSVPFLFVVFIKSFFYLKKF